MIAPKTVSSHALLAIAFAATVLAGPVEARRGGSFGSRGSHTYYSPASTRLSQGTVAPVQRTMTPRPGYTQPSYGSPSYAPAARPRFGFGGGLLTGLVTGGLIGAMFGHHGFGGAGYGGGGGGGLLALLLQIAVLGGVVWLVMRLFRGRGPSTSGQPFEQQGGFGSGGFGGQPGFGAAAAAPPQEQGLALTSADQQAFERLLAELQDAFGHEDYARLRAITTPEVMSYLAEELSDNATHNRRNEVTGTRLLDGEISEAWNEGDVDYATVAMRYESTDIMRDRTTNAVLPGGSTTPSETTELWTFVRPAGSWSGWKVSAIQEG